MNLSDLGLLSGLLFGVALVYWFYRRETRRRVISRFVDFPSPEDLHRLFVLLHREASVEVERCAQDPSIRPQYERQWKHIQLASAYLVMEFNALEVPHHE